jgi:ferritin-like metal-binding protein YciE
MAEPVTSAEDLFQARLRQMLFVELKLADEVLPELIEQAAATDLRHAFERHLLETREHAATLRDVLSELQAHAEPEESPALLGLVTEHEQLVKRIEASGHLVSDLAHAEAAAATEHLEMSAYDMLASMADALGQEEIATRLRRVMEQEELALELVERAVAKLLAEKVESARLE